MLSMPPQVRDKTALWSHVTRRLAEDLEPGLAFMLMDRCYLDSVENGKAIVAAKTEAVKRQIERNAALAIQNALSEALASPVQVSIALARPRIFDMTRSKTALCYDIASMDEEKEAEALYEKYGDIMSIVNKHTLFKQVSKPLDEGGWGLFPQVLTNACKDYGVKAILKGLRDTAERSDITKARAAFLAELADGKFGVKLPFGAKVF